MKLIQNYLINNPCYKAGRKISVKGLMLHSVGTPQPDAKVFMKMWNRADYKRACVHGFIDANDGTVYQTLPWNHRGWHAGGSGNNSYIGVEMCEPAVIKYTAGANFNCSDLKEAQEAARKTYESAVELFAMLCEEFNLNPLRDGVIVSHREGHQRGIASNHGDPEHLWKGLKLPYTMDGFRQDVAANMKREYRNKNTQEDEDMDVVRFKELWTEMRKDLRDNDAGSWSEEARKWAVENGIVTGDDSKEFNGMWQDVLTREQMVTVLYRFARLMGKA